MREIQQKPVEQQDNTIWRNRHLIRETNGKKPETSITRNFLGEF